MFIPASIPGGDRLRSDLEDLSASQHPDWNPHVTLAFQDEGDEPITPQSHKVVTFTHLSVHRGDDVRRFPFGGATQATKGTSGTMETKVGPKGFVHGWHFLGVPGTGDAVHHPSHGKGIVTAVDDKHVSVRFGSGAERTFEHSAPKPGKASGFVKRGDHDAEHGNSSAAAHAATPHLARAAKARELAKAIRASGEDAQMEGRQGGSASSALEQAATHFGAGDHVAGVRAANDARHALHDEADKASFEAGSHANVAGRLRSYDPQGAAEAAARSGTAASRADMLRQHAGRASAITMEPPARPAREAARAAKPGGEFSPGYLRGEGATDSDVTELARRYMVMHGKPPTAAEVAKIKRAKPGGKTATVMSRDEGLAKARSIHEADKAAGGGHLPPLALLGNDKHADGSVSARAVDHEGRDYAVKLGADKTVTVTHKGKSLTEHGGANPTQKARELAGKLTAPAPAEVKPEADDFWAHEPAPLPPAPPAPKPKFDQGAMFAEPDKLGTAPMFGDKWGTGDVTRPAAGTTAAEPATHAAHARGLAANVRFENGLTKGQKEEAETRLNAAARHLDAGNHAEAVRELDDTAHATGLRGGGVIKGSTAARARDLAAQVRTEHGIAPKVAEKPANWEHAVGFGGGGTFFSTVNGHRASVNFGGRKSGGDYHAYVGTQRIGSDKDVNVAKRMAEDHARSLPAPPPRPARKLSANEVHSGEARDIGNRIDDAAEAQNSDLLEHAASAVAKARGHLDEDHPRQAVESLNDAEDMARRGVGSGTLDAGSDEHVAAIAGLRGRVMASTARQDGHAGEQEPPVLSAFASDARGLASAAQPREPEAALRLRDAAEHMSAGRNLDALHSLATARDHLAGSPVGKQVGILHDRVTGVRNRLYPSGEAKANPVVREVKDLASSITSVSGRENAVRRHLADASAAIEEGDTKTAYGALDLARRHALGEFGANPLRPVLLDDKTEAWRPIVRLRDSVRATAPRDA